jgi:3D (Asp-Asp-Asp) domain-containing protein
MATPAPLAPHSISFTSGPATTTVQTAAATVADFLRERGIVAGANDEIVPAPQTPLSDGMVVIYRVAVPVTIETAHERIALTSSADDVGALLEEAHVHLGANDRVQPSLASAVPAGGTVRITRVVTWERTQQRAIAAITEHRIDFEMAPGSSKVVSRGASGEREIVVQFMQRDGGKIERRVVASTILRKPQPRIIVEGADEYDAFERFADRSVDRTVYIARSALQMVATAYTADCAGCSGTTAIGLHAGHGIVAVDPSVIPLGSKLYIPGYGMAIAGDTGGAIVGNRIDLGFNSSRDAMLFGRRQVTVYRIK